MMHKPTPPFKITPRILLLISEIENRLGQIHAYFGRVYKQSVLLRKSNKIKTIHHSLAIEGNTLAEDQITAILENKKVLGKPNEIKEVQNALILYNQLDQLNPFDEKSFLKAHAILMKGLIREVGKYRLQAVGILKGSKVNRIAPQAKYVPRLMSELFFFLNEDKQTHGLIKACVFHYELELIHPFLDGNGRMGRLWQQLILMKYAPIFEFLTLETWIHRYQKQYYRSLEASDVAGESTAFIEYSLEMIREELNHFISSAKPSRPTAEDRIEAAREFFASKKFSRKDYCHFHKNISAPTASRDLAQAVEHGQLFIEGKQALARYKFSK